MAGDHWKEVERLEGEQKYEAASKRVREILDRATELGDEEERTRALVRLVQLRTALHGYETAVGIFQEEEWPEDQRLRSIVELFYAHGLVSYLDAYSWEIRQRERTSAAGLKTWTVDQIAEEANRSFARVWSGRDAWGEKGVGTLGEYLEKNDYPKHIRGTLRDTVAYLWARLLADTSLWRPEQSNQIYRLKLDELLEPDSEAPPPLDDPAVHPLTRISALLGGLEAWHHEGGRPEAALEARLALLRRLHASFTRRDDRAAILQDLENHLQVLGEEPEWWSMGMAQLAQFVREDSAPDSLARSRDIALAGAEAHPESIGGRRCRYAVASIEAPGYNLSAMRLDGAGKRSVQVRFRNVDRLHFRAYRMDLRRQIESSSDYNLLPGDRDVQRLVRGRGNAGSAAAGPVAEWAVDLPPTPDFREHQHYVTPPLEQPGLYVVAASARPGFEREGNHLTAVNLIVSDLVIATRQRDDTLRVTVRSGATGDPVPGASISLYEADYRNNHRRLRDAVADVSGNAAFELAGDRASYFLVAESDGDVSLDPSIRRARRERAPRDHERALVYTDRSVYRPSQSLHWKVVAYHGASDDFSTLPGKELRVTLTDANGQAVSEQDVTTNDFGSASGSFEIPAGRLLGNWSLRTSISGGASVKVEEYKRPTFEVELGEAEEALRLNRPAEIGGEARYYFGLPVVDADVDWTVVREPVYPYWWSWYGGPRANRETVATGSTAVEPDGTFRISFTPRADEREAGSGIVYRYRLSADVTEAGGETRSAERVVTLGWVAVRTTVAGRGRFFDGDGDDGGATFDLSRTDLDGAPRAGGGTWRLTALQQPPEALLPAEMPVPEPPGGEAERPYRTEGDALRPRWQTRFAAEQVMRTWKDGEELRSGTVEHGEDGTAELALARLAPGAYRLHYQTSDPYGATFETATEFVVVQSGGTGGSRLELPIALWPQIATVPLGGTARLLVHSGLADQELLLEIFRRGADPERRRLASNDGLRVVEIPVGPEHRGGFGVRLTALRDHQMMEVQTSVHVPWDDRRLDVDFATFRDKLRPGGRETWRVTVRSPDETALAAGSAELLAYMYDRSLDFFGPHQPADPMDLYPTRLRFDFAGVNLGAGRTVWSHGRNFVVLPDFPSLTGDRLKFFDGYGIGGPARRMRRRYLKRVAAAPMMAEEAMAAAPGAEADTGDSMQRSLADDGGTLASDQAAAVGEAPLVDEDPLRTDFSETAFFEPHLRLDEDGSVAIEFEVPDSVTEWNVWVHALTTDLRSGRVQKRTRSVKELMVRPALPRFLREGDTAELRVVINNAGETELTGSLAFDVLDPETETSLAPEFGLGAGDDSATSTGFSVAAGGSTTLSFPIRVPPRVGQVAFRAVATAGEFSDGELRPLPVLPSRMHLAQSRFVSLRDADRREMTFEDLAADDDPTRIDEALVVTLDTQLFYGVLSALPYLVDYPYECTEQTLNRFLSTGILSSLYEGYPAVAAMAKKLSERDTRFETWDAADPNRKMALEETPWLVRSRGGDEDVGDLIRVLDPRIARAERRIALAKLEKSQTSLGGFPWWPGGPPSPYLTLYILGGFSRALEFGVDVPRDLIEDAWSYMHRHYLDKWAREMVSGKSCCWEFVTYLNYVLSSYPDESWTGGVFTAEERERMLDFSFKHWRDHSPLLKSYLALTLARDGRREDAKLVFDSVMDSAKTTRDEGTFWAPEDRGWLWYNDRIETHAFALRTLAELQPDDERRDGLVHWLLLNKKLNHWKSTRATAEAIYALTHYLQQEGTLGVREAVDVTVGERSRSFVFEPDEYSGKKNQVVLQGDEIDPATSSTVVVEKETPGLAFASATWHFSTERLPEEASGDFFRVERSYYRRVHDGREWTLEPLADASELAVGDQVEVHLSVRSKHAAEYVHLRDPRPAGFEPESATSSFKWDLGLGYYEEIRDSGANFFFEWLPVGEYTFKYRLRATVAGTFKAGPATLQSMYAPEFTGYSAGDALTIGRVGG